MRNPKKLFMSHGDRGGAGKSLLATTIIGALPKTAPRKNTKPKTTGGQHHE